MLFYTHLLCFYIVIFHLLRLLAFFFMLSRLPLTTTRVRFLGFTFLPFFYRLALMIYFRALFLPSMLGVVGRPRFLNFNLPASECSFTEKKCLSLALKRAVVPPYFRSISYTLAPTSSKSLFIAKSVFT